MLGVIQEYIRSSQVFGNTVQWLPLLFGWTKHSVSSKLSVSYLFFKVHLEAHWPLKLGKICSYASRGCEVRGDQSLKLCIGNKGTQTLTTCKFAAHWYKSAMLPFFKALLCFYLDFLEKGWNIVLKVYQIILKSVNLKQTYRVIYPNKSTTVFLKVFWDTFRSECHVSKSIKIQISISLFLQVKHECVLCCRLLLANNSLPLKRSFKGRILLLTLTL